MTTRVIRFKHREGYVRRGVGSRQRPYISCALTANGQRFSVMALVDSGADGCRFPVSYGEALGFDFSGEVGETSSGFGGDTQVYYRTVMLTFAGRTFPVEARFDPHARDWQAVLGREGFFTAFFVGFEETQRAVYFNPL